MVGLRFIIHAGALSDVNWLCSIGFDEAGLCCNWGDAPSAMFIHNAGIKYATLNPFIDMPMPPATPGGKYAHMFQVIETAGWDMVAGPDISGDVVRACMNHMPFCSYGGYGYSTTPYDKYSGQCSVYTAPFNHPIAGPGTYHVDYIGTDKSTRWYQSCIDVQQVAVAAGNCAEVGIAIGLWDGAILDSSVWIGVIERARAQGIPCNNVCFLGDIDADAVTVLQGDANEVLTTLIRTYGVRHGIGSVGAL